MADAPTPRTAVKRLPERGVYDRATIDAILDEALICHLAWVQDGSPRIIPTIHARDEASAKVRIGPAKDDEEDYDLPIWAGVLPLTLTPGEIVEDPRLQDGLELPDNVRDYRR